MAKKTDTPEVDNRTDEEKAAAAAEEAAAKAAAEAADAEKPEEPALYMSKIRLFNPDQNKYLHDMPQPLDIDNYWQCQLDAGVMTKVR